MTIDISVEYEMGCQVEKLYSRVTLSAGEGWGEVIAATNCNAPYFLRKNSANFVANIPKLQNDDGSSG